MSNLSDPQLSQQVRKMDQDILGLRHSVNTSTAELRGEMAELRGEITANMAEIRVEIQAINAAVVASNQRMADALTATMLRLDRMDDSNTLRGT